MVTFNFFPVIPVFLVVDFKYVVRNFCRILIKKSKPIVNIENTSIYIFHLDLMCMIYKMLNSLAPGSEGLFTKLTSCLFKEHYIPSHPLKIS